MNNRYGFVRISCVTPPVKPADTRYNTDSIIEGINRAAAEQPDIILLPELCITGYTCADLFSQSSLLEKAQAALLRIAESVRDVSAVVAVGLPLAVKGRLYNCAALVCRGVILGIVPKTYIPNHNEFYEGRWFESGANVNDVSAVIGDIEVPFGTDLLFSTASGFRIGVEICEDMWAPVPPSAGLAMSGAEVILNLSASNELAGKAAYRRRLISNLSGQYLSVYAYCSSGGGESSTDTVYGGHSLIAEHGRVLAEGTRFADGIRIISADADLDFIKHERIVNRTFGQCCSLNTGFNTRTVAVPQTAAVCPVDSAILLRSVDPMPFVPSGEEGLHERCSEIFSIQSSGLAIRLRSIGCRTAVIGMSGGLDSTLALLVTVRAFRMLGLDLSGIRCVTMPGFGTTGRTKSNAGKLCSALGLGMETIDITEACNLHLRDIGHDGVTTDITYENTQARERTQILMDLSNKYGGIVIGTGDLSELAMGWCTYNGDHMSMYAVNSGVPKTLVKYLVRYYAENEAESDAAEVLADIIDTPISPELLPPDPDGNIAQKTEDNIGPYELHDFFLYNVVRCGFAPEKVLFLAEKAFGTKYSRSEALKWLRLFYRRFFSQQFKRSAIPDGPKVGTIALSPRADWRMPSDASVSDWLADLDMLDTAESL